MSLIEIAQFAGVVLLAGTVYAALAHPRALRTVVLFCAFSAACLTLIFSLAKSYGLLGGVAGMIFSFFVSQRFERWMMQRSIRLDRLERERLDKRGDEIRTKIIGEAAPQEPTRPSASQDSGG